MNGTWDWIVKWFVSMVIVLRLNPCDLLINNTSNFDSYIFENFRFSRRNSYYLLFAFIRFRVVKGGWNRECGPNMKVYQTASLNRWYVVYPRQMEREINKFFRRVVEVGQKMNFHIKTPKAYAVLKSHYNNRISLIHEIQLYFSFFFLLFIHLIESLCRMIENWHPK